MKPPQTRTERTPRKLALVDAAWLLVWGCGAVLFGMAGVGAYLFTRDLPTPTARAGLALPPPGDVRSTGAIDGGGRMEVEVYPSTGGLQATEAMRRLKVEVDALRSEVAGLRRALAVLQERDRQLSERLRTFETSARGAAGEKRSNGGVEAEATPGPQVSDARVQAPAPVDAAPPATVPPPVETLAAPETMVLPEATPEPPKPPAAVAVLPPEFSRPVRVVSPENGDGPNAVGSIPTDEANTVPPAPVDKPTAAGQAAGRIAPSDVPIERTDFAVDLGTYADADAAAAAWAAFRSDLDVLADLSPRLAARAGRQGGKDQALRLLAGPFANAADAAAACVRLAGDNVACQPTVYLGKPLAGQ